MIILINHNRIIKNLKNLAQSNISKTHGDGEKNKIKMTDSMVSMKGMKINNGKHLGKIINMMKTQNNRVLMKVLMTSKTIKNNKTPQSHYKYLKNVKKV